MTESRTVHDPFLGKDVQVSNRLTDRLRGRYASGPTLANGEPEFGWRDFPTPPIQKQAADLIEVLVAALENIKQLSDCKLSRQMAADALVTVGSPPNPSK